MNNLKLEKTNHTPFVSLTSGKIEISGRSIPEDPVAFYKPVLDWLEDYKKSPSDKTIVNLNFEYINTSSSKALHNILKSLNEGFDNSHKMEINWHYEVGDDDMFELGQFFQPYISIPMNFIETEE
jgi:hypothetical protein